MANAQQDKEVRFEAFANGARKYGKAADLLLQMRETENDLLMPVYMLYFHAAELALKGFLRFSGTPTSALKKDWKHNLSGLYREALACGLAPDEMESQDIENVMNLLHSGNKREGFRYFTWESTARPEIEWTGKAVNMLIELVEKRTGIKKDEKPGLAVKLDIVVHQPTPRTLN